MSGFEPTQEPPALEGQLSSEHLVALVQGSGLSQDVIRGRGYRTTSTRAEMKRRGFSDAQAMVPALLIPVYGTSGDIVLYQARPDTPRIKDGKPIKYETPRGSRMVLDVHPAARAALADPDTPLFVTEGIKKGDCLVSHGYCAVALLGVWNWRGTNELGGKTSLPDWESVALNGRQVYVIFDSDVMLKPQVHGALARFKPFLESRGAHVLLIYLLVDPSGKKTGVDDYLVAGHTMDELLALATPTLRSLPKDATERDQPYRATESGLWWHKPTQNGDVDVPLTNFSARITSDVAEDDGVEIRRRFDIAATLHGRSHHVSVPASQFADMGWPVELLGAGAIIYPGFGLKDHARTAVQLLSGTIPERRVYTHTGWRKVDAGWVFLHAGGAIGTVGPVPEIIVDLPSDLARYVLPTPPTGDPLREAVRASLALLELAPDQVTVPCLGAIYRTVLGRIDFTLHLAGPTGAGKTELVALAQQHFGPAMDSRHLPASWLSTGNALEGLAFQAKDVLLVVDDFAPTGTASDVQRYHKEADRLFRGQGNQAGRGRMRPDGSLRPAKPPRGLILSTGEDIPRGQSLRARCLFLELGPNDLDWQRLNGCQQDAASGRFALAMAGYLQWLVADYETIQSTLAAETAALREQATDDRTHRRTPGVIADLAVGLQYFLRFSVECGAITASEQQALWERCWNALLAAGAAQATHHQDAEPTRRFLQLLAACLGSGRGHLAAIDGGVPKHPQAWGWRESSVGIGNSARGEWRAQGQRIGWVADADIYLEPVAAFAAVQELGNEVGEPLTVLSKTLNKRLAERGLLRSQESVRNKHTVRRVIEGARRYVLHMDANLFLGESSQTSHNSTDAEANGPIPWADNHPVLPESAHNNGPGEQPMLPEDAGAGPIGPIGPIPGPIDEEEELRI